MQRFILETHFFICEVGIDHVYVFIISQIEIYREDPPHGDCEDVDDDDNKIKNLWRSQFYWLNYTSQVRVHWH